MRSMTTKMSTPEGSDPKDRPTSAKPPVPGLPQPVPIDWLGPNPYQPRQRPLAEDAGIDALAEDMRRFGFRGALQARHDPQNPQGKLQLVFGHRRLEAARRAGLTTVPVQVVAYTDEQMEQSALRENLLREDLTPWEEALALQRLRDRGLTYHQIGDFVGKSVGWVQNRLALLKTEGALREAAMHHPDLLTVITTLLHLPPADREALLERVRAGALNVEDLRVLVRAKREAERRREAETLPGGGRRIDVPLPPPSPPGPPQAAPPHPAPAAEPRRAPAGDAAPPPTTPAEVSVGAILDALERLIRAYRRVTPELLTPEQRQAIRDGLQEIAALLDDLLGEDA
jgi:ParB family chromosome partitioning protein